MGDKYCSSDYDYYKGKYNRLKREKEYSSYKENNCCKEERHSCSCSCRGTASFAPVPNSQVLVDICPNCKDKDSIIFFQTVNFLLRSDSICPPKCFNIAGLGRALSACGPGVFIVGGTFYEGIVSVVLVERPGALDLISLSFNGINNAGGTVVLLAPFNVPDANLSITDCKANGCSCNQNGAFPMPFGDSFINPSEIVNKAVIIHLDGTVEEIQF